MGRPGLTKGTFLVVKRGIRPRRPQLQVFWARSFQPAQDSVRPFRALPPPRRPMLRGRSDLRRPSPPGALILVGMLMHRRPYRNKIAYAFAMWRTPMPLFHQKLPRKPLSLMSLCRYAILEVQISIHLHLLWM